MSEPISSDPAFNEGREDQGAAAINGRDENQLEEPDVADIAARASIEGRALHARPDVPRSRSSL